MKIIFIMIFFLDFSLIINNKLSRRTSIIFGITLILVFTASSMSVSYGSFVGSPNFQLESGVVPENITCKEDLVLVLRANGSPVCITEITAEKIGWEIINTFEIFTTKQTSKVVELNVSSPVEFVDDGREIQISVLQRSPAPWPMYDTIITSMNDGFSVSEDGVATITSKSHEKYSINTDVGFYTEDWLPDYIPDGQKVLYADTTCFEKTGDCTLGIHFVPNTFVLNQNITNAHLQISKGFSINITYSPSGLDEIDDLIEYVKEIKDAQPNNYGLGFVDMSRDGKSVYAYEGGNSLNHYRSVISFHPDEYTSVGILSYYHTLDELIPIFDSVMK